jgi:hypothetical protein
LTNLDYNISIIGGALGAGYGWYIGFRRTVDCKINSGNINRSIRDNNDSNQSLGFGNLSTEELAMMAQLATQDAIRDLHQKGISTYGMQDGIIYETNPVTSTKFSC